MAMDDTERKQIYDEFNEVVNMTKSELRDWLQTDESKSVGQKDSENAESTGHASGKRILDIQDKKKADLTESDYEHMQKVHGYVARHMAQGPESDVEHLRWRYSLMNWGHDPLKD